MLAPKGPEDFMRQALHQAEKAMDDGEVPVGAVIVYENKIIAKAHNRVEASMDPTAHAEILAIGSAAAHLNSWRLDGCTLYVTLEPCPMCAGALLNARIGALVYGVEDQRLGACGSTCDILRAGLLNRSISINSGVLAEESKSLLQFFFQNLRQLKKERKESEEEG